MNATLEALTELLKRITADAEEFKSNEDVYYGLKRAADMVSEEIQNQHTCAEVDAMSDKEVIRFISLPNVQAQR